LPNCSNSEICTIQNPTAGIYHADRQRGLDRDVRIGALASGFAAGRSTPGIEGGIREPDCEVASLA